MKTGSWGEYLDPRGMRIGIGEGSTTRNFIVCTVFIFFFIWFTFSLSNWFCNKANSRLGSEQILVRLHDSMSALSAVTRALHNLTKHELPKTHTHQLICYTYLPALSAKRRKLWSDRWVPVSSWRVPASLVVRVS